MPLPTIQLVLNTCVDIDWLRPLVDAGLDGLQVRVRDDSTRRLVAFVTSLVVAFPDVDLAVNGRVDVAMATGIGAVQVPSHGIPVADVRRIAPYLRITRSVHSVEEAVVAEQEGADAVTFGHVFNSRSHPGEAGRGADALSAAVGAVSIPVVAIGGIRPEDIAVVRNCGASGIAVIGAITEADDPATVVRRFKEEWISCDSRSTRKIITSTTRR